MDSIDLKVHVCPLNKRLLCIIIEDVLVRIGTLNESMQKYAKDFLKSPNSMLQKRAIINTMMRFSRIHPTDSVNLNMHNRPLNKHLRCIIMQDALMHIGTLKISMREHVKDFLISPNNIHTERQLHKYALIAAMMRF